MRLSETGSCGHRAQPHQPSESFFSGATKLPPSHSPQGAWLLHKLKKKKKIKETGCSVSKLMQMPFFNRGQHARGFPPRGELTRDF